jgi:uncharacterized protein
MTDVPLARPGQGPIRRQAWLRQRVWTVSALILVVLLVFDPAQAGESALFAGGALVNIAPYLVLSIALAAYAGATGADNLIARAFSGAPWMMIVLGALAGALSPFCSCGVIPLIAALLAMGVPLSAVMAFWLASPVMDPSMFVLTAGVLDLDFAIGKTLAAIGLGLLGGGTVHLLSRGGALANPLREGIGNGGCGGAKVRAPKPVVWRFWIDATRARPLRPRRVVDDAVPRQMADLGIPHRKPDARLGPGRDGDSDAGWRGLLPIVTATLVGVPAYLNGYAALPLVGGLIEQGMAPGAGMAFLVAGGVTSIPAAMAVWALARPPVFALYIALSLSGAFVSGILFQFWSLA